MLHYIMPLYSPILRYTSNLPDFRLALLESNFITLHTVVFSFEKKKKFFCANSDTQNWPNRFPLIANDFICALIGAKNFFFFHVANEREYTS